MIKIKSNVETPFFLTLCVCWNHSDSMQPKWDIFVWERERAMCTDVIFIFCVATLSIKKPSFIYAKSHCNHYVYLLWSLTPAKGLSWLTSPQLQKIRNETANSGEVCLDMFYIYIYIYIKLDFRNSLLLCFKHRFTSLYLPKKRFYFCLLCSSTNKNEIIIIS